MRTIRIDDGGVIQLPPNRHVRVTAGPHTAGMTFTGNPLPLQPPHPSLAAIAAQALDSAGPDTATRWAASARDIRQQSLHVLRCTAQDLATGAGGLRFTPGARPWLDGLVPTAAIRAAQRGSSRLAPAPGPRC